MIKRNELDKPVCNCGVFGILGDDSAAAKTYYGLHALQHRGQEAAGIVTLNDNTKKPGRKLVHVHKNMGLVSEIFGAKNIFTEKLIGNSAIGHNRYSTSGASKSNKNIQPFVVNYRLGNLAVAHNGNLTNARELRKKLIDEGSIFQTTSDTEVILHLIAKSKLDKQEEQIREALGKVQGAFSIVLLTDTKLIGVRDPQGFRPLCIGKTKDSFIITSESCALDINSAEYIRDVEPGEIVIIDKDTKDVNGIKSVRMLDEKTETKHCVFEFIYFSRPDSKIFNSSVDKIRRKLGKVLAMNHPVEDKDGGKVIVISVPDSSNTAALGYQSQLEKMGISSKFEIGLLRSHYIGRTFIIPGQQNREIGVKIKFNTVKGVLEGRTIVVVDDSIVRGTTSKLLVNLIKEANPKEVHLRISSPMISYPCYYGMDFPSREELIANKMNGDLEKIRQELGVDSLAYMEIDEMLDAMVDHDKEEFCTACFSGNYPVKINENFNKEAYYDD
ncbi:MAG: amidophosphoribosyltransferase [Melioribacteraceae bacterium]|nr:MAG: amidophosphoribosyltransferase [Melioribacteraceae bacterium]